MADVFKVAELLVNNAIKNYGQEVDLIAYTGSYARGEARDDSDLDIFYVPADGKKPPITRTFLLDGRLFDFWAISWNTMEGFATGRIRGWSFAPALVHHSRVLYARTGDQAAKLEELKRKIVDLQKPEARPQMIKRAVNNFGHTMAYVAKVRLAVEDKDLTNARYAGWQAVESTWESLSLANQVFFHRGLGKSLSEAAKFKDKPEGLSQLIKTIITSGYLDQVLEACEQLALSTRQVLRRLQESMPSHSSVQEQFQEAYPEMRDKVGKLLAACKRGDVIAAHAEAHQLQHDITLTLYRTTEGAGDIDFNQYSELATLFREYQFPDLLQFSTGSLEELAEQAELLDEKFRRFLTEHSVELCEIRTLDELKRSLQLRKDAATL